ncbi:MAG: hypothetical protein ACI90V_004464 [Bacillariaceae sp.]
MCGGHGVVLEQHFHYYPKDTWNQVRAHNSHVKTLIDASEISRREAGKAPSSISYIGFGQAMLPQLYPQEKRIHGGINTHYGRETPVL